MTWPTWTGRFFLGVFFFGEPRARKGIALTGERELTGDCFLSDSQVIADEDKKALETLSNAIIKEKQPFERLEMSKEELLEMFKYSKYKEYFVSQRVPDGTKSTVYRCGPLIDLCRGPHVPHTGNIKALAVLRVCLHLPTSLALPLSPSPCLSLYLLFWRCCCRRCRRCCCICPPSSSGRQR